jgi:hypothetical protein
MTNILNEVDSEEKSESVVDVSASINCTLTSCSLVHRVRLPSLFFFFSFSPVTSKERRRKKI